MSRVELIEAVRAGTASAVEQAIAAGADVNQQDMHGWTPLCWAAGRGMVEIVELLIAHGADPHRTGRDNRTPAAIAIAAGRVEAARLLRKAEGKAPAPRKYCKAYRVAELRRFAGWPAGPADQDLPEVAYVHETYRVTASMWPEEEILFEGGGEAWQRFCHDELGFVAPDDLDLMGRRP